MHLYRVAKAREEESLFVYWKKDRGALFHVHLLKYMCGQSMVQQTLDIMDN